MKNIYLITAILMFGFVFAQNKNEAFTNLVKAEIKSVAKRSNLAINPNTKNYDITYHKLEFKVNPDVKFISGKVTTTFTALSDISTITFDFANELTASAVKENGVSLTFTENSNNELIINLPETQTSGTAATIEITYSGVPPQNGFDSFVNSTHNGIPIIWTLSEPFGARDWWPCKQDLNDKIDSIDVYITAPSQYISVSNGIEITAPVIVGTNKTTHFHHSYPIPAYLIAIAVTNYSVYTQTNAGTAPNQYPIVNYIFPESLASVQPQLEETPNILNLYESLFEVYPFHNEKYGHAQFGWGGGMEHTTVSFMVNFDRQLIAHEMAHQWFGDKITCGSWNDIWLNEGFATYLAAMVIENFDGIDAFIADKTNMINNITSVSNGNLYLTNAEATNVNRIFDDRLSYNKGAMVLEMLRFKLGDASFFKAIKNYLADTNLAYKYAVTSDLKAHLEAVYGNNLDEFFNDWVYNQGFPSYAITAQNTGTSQVHFILHQSQSDASVNYFEMPVPVRVFGANGEQADLILENIFDGEEFTKNVPFIVTSFSIDPDKHLISNNNSTTLGNARFDYDQSMSLSPNPTTNYLNLHLPKGMYVEKATFYNNLGQVVKESTTATNWDISSFAKGVYYIKAETNLGDKHMRFIKK
jgi:aminopeptidase N